MIDDKNFQQPHSLIMENRNKLEITGVKNVDTFDDENIIMSTCRGELTVKGSNLNIEKFSIETTEIGISGDIIALVYTSDRSTGGFFSKMFR